MGKLTFNVLKKISCPLSLIPTHWTCIALQMNVSLSCYSIIEIRFSCVTALSISHFWPSLKNGSSCYLGCRPLAESKAHLHLTCIIPLWIKCQGQMAVWKIVFLWSLNFANAESYRPLRLPRCSCIIIVNMHWSFPLDIWFVSLTDIFGLWHNYQKTTFWS